MSAKAAAGATALPERSAFNIPPGVAYLNAAAYGPLSLATLEAGKRAIVARAAPWQFDKAAVAADIARAREHAAALIGVESQDLALLTSVSHSAAIAARVLPAVRGTRVLRLAGEHPSNVLPWVEMTRCGCVEEVVPEPADGDWTRAVLEAIEQPGAAPLAVAAFSPYRWSDGARLDLDLVIPAARRSGGAVFIDATHVVGVDTLDVTRQRPDFVAFPLFKWLMGPYGTAFLYVDPLHQNGEPTDRSATNSLLTPTLDWAGFARGARRYDRGERDDPVSAAIAASALSEAVSWNPQRVSAHVRKLGLALAEAAQRAGVAVLPERLRAPHILGMSFSSAGRAGEIAQGLAARGVIVSERGRIVRVTPHLYNDMSDVERFSSALAGALRT